jgi:hypothetical protein
LDSDDKDREHVEEKLNSFSTAYMHLTKRVAVFVFADKY